MERVTIPCWKFIIKLDKLRTFMSLEKAVCNHGFFMMAPNHWDPSTKSFSRPLRLADSITSAMTLISQHEDHLVIKVYGAAVLSLKDEGAIKVRTTVLVLFLLNSVSTCVSMYVVSGEENAETL